MKTLAGTLVEQMQESEDLTCDKQLIFFGIRKQWLPIVKKERMSGKNGENRPLFVKVDPSHDRWRAVLAQEIWESIHKTNPVNLIRTRFSDSAQRKMEIMGHECEVQAAKIIYGVDTAAYRAREARAMHNGYGRIFKDMAPDIIADKMEARSNEARRWVEKNISRLEEA